MSVLITNIGMLVNVREQNDLLRGAALSGLPCIKDAYLIIEDGKIEDWGATDQLTTHHSLFTIIDARKRSLLIK
jgi:imidazolonepropionase